MDNILERIYKSAIKFLHPLNMNQLYEVIVKEAIKLVDAKYGSLILEEQGELVRAYSTLPNGKDVPIRRNGFTRQAFDTQKAFVRHSKDDQTFHRKIAQIGVRSNIYIPLSNKNKSVGVLVVNSTKDQSFTQEQLSILKLFGTFASISIRKNQLYDEIIHALETRDLFISMAAHELRTPLTTISGYAQLLQAKLSKTNSPESRWADEMSWETFRLTMLVNELLEISRIKSGKLHYHLKEVSLKSIIERAINSFRFSHPHRIVRFSCELDNKSDLVVGDFDKLLQVVTNLVDNALKYSSDDSEVVIKLTLRSPYLILKVQDKGKGIDKKDLPKIFNGYYQGQTNNEVSGLGLGLYLTKNIIRRHRGTINVSSKLNKGTTMEVKLPVVEKKYERESQ